MDSNENEYVYEYLDEQNEEETFDESSSNQVLTVLEGIPNLEDKIQDDLDLIALVEGNSKLYAKGRTGYRNAQEKDLAWIYIGKAMKYPISGSEAKHRWEMLRNLYGRARREIVALIKQQEQSGSGRDNVSYEDLLTPQSKAIHRFMSCLYVPRKTVSNYTNPSLCTSSSSLSFSASGSKRTSSKLPSRSLLLKQSSQSLMSAPRTSTVSSPKGSPVNSFLWNQDFENTSENTENADSESSFIVPKSDIKRRKKTDLGTESVLKESSQAIYAACSALPSLLSETTSKAETEEEKGMGAILLHGLKRVPEQQRMKCMIKLLETLEAFTKSE